ncbi:MAG: hypothetical protein JNL38_16410 [Myxococcales bacterium]|jgi:hypothetical protein|nr:hypothetical protein [Myxococcales bacterium]
MRRALLILSLAAVGCSSAQASRPPVPVSAAPPPKDDGKPAEGGQGGDQHAAALEQLKSAKVEPRIDKQDSVRVPLPDGGRWARVRFWGVPSLVGFRYGKDHHAVVGAFVTHVPDNGAPQACSKSFESIAQPMVEAFEVTIKHDAPQAFPWNRQIVDVDVLFAKTATVLAREEYAASYATYPVWKNACLVVGVAIPARGEPDRARDVRDRFVKDVFPKIEVVAKDEPAERF